MNQYQKYLAEQDEYYNEATAGEGIVGEIQPFPTYEEWLKEEG